MKNFIIEWKETFRREMHDIVMGALFLFWMYLFYTINSSIKWKYVIGFLVFGGLILLCTWMRMGKEDNKDYEKTNIR